MPKCAAGWEATVSSKKEPKSTKPRIGVFKFASCDGCQLSLLDLEDDLVAIVGAVDFAFFPEMSSNMRKGPYDIGLVEGSVTTHHDASRIHEIRKECKTLVAIGACATSGGIQALRNWADSKQWVGQVYAHPEYIHTLSMSTPIGEHVPIDFELRGCPVSKHQLLELVSATLAGRRPNIPTYSVCMECKRKGNVCIAVAQHQACLGPATQAGCGAICPSFGRGCYGCFGPAETPNTVILADQLLRDGRAPATVLRDFRSFNAWAWPCRQAGERTKAI
jgi:coenzyme F420-reducing hydrogenase gamma subunit